MKKWSLNRVEMKLLVEFNMELCFSQAIQPHDFQLHSRVHRFKQKCFFQASLQNFQQEQWWHSLAQGLTKGKFFLELINVVIIRIRFSKTNNFNYLATIESECVNELSDDLVEELRR